MTALVCHRCGRVFRTAIGLGVHLAHLRKAKAQRHAERLCPDRRSVEERRAADMQKLRLKTALGLLGRHP